MPTKHDIFILKRLINCSYCKVLALVFFTELSVTSCGLHQCFRSCHGDCLVFGHVITVSGDVSGVRTPCWWLINSSMKTNYSQIWIQDNKVWERWWFCRTVAVFDNKCLPWAVQLHWMWTKLSPRGQCWHLSSYSTPQHIGLAICYQWISSVLLHKATS